jgi:hypothetical protein
VNLPIAIAAPDGWALAFRFQALRRPNPDSLWGVLATDLDLAPAAVNVLSTAAVALVVAAVLIACGRRARREGVYPMLPGCAALLTAFLLFGKVHSPQHALWLVPLFVLLSVGAGWYWLFVAGNVVLYAAIFAVPGWWGEGAKDVLVTWSVWARTATFLALVVVFLRAPAFSLVERRRSAAIGEDRR